MKNPEILAPAGSGDSVRAAVLCGADAVYLGLPRFSARAEAQNFTMDDLAEAIEYCHVRGVKVYLTFNTLLFGDRELRESIPLLREAVTQGVDAFIVQDLGALRLLRDISPETPLHASTQMSILSTGGLEAAKALGLSRVVLPRELSREEISQMTQGGIETEVFVHGALCMSVSGQCYLSAALGGRSGNRGRCAGPCRLPFEKDCYPLSLKDLSLVDHLTELKALGINSFKIEGRLRRPEYVAAVVTACRQALAGQAIDRDLLESAFSRSGFTDGYFTGHRGPSMFGIRTGADVKRTEQSQSALSALIERDKPTVPVYFTVSFRPGFALVTVTDGCLTASLEGNAPEKALSRATNREDVIKAFSKTQDTPFFPETIDVTIDSDTYLSAAELNRLRRESLQELYRLRITPSQTAFPYTLPPSVMRVQRIPRLYAVFHRPIAAVGDGFSPLEMAAVPRDMLESASGIKNIAIKTERIHFGDDKNEEEKLKELRRDGIKTAFVSHLGTVVRAKNAGMTVWGNFTLNCSNRLAAVEMSRLGVDVITLSPEVHPKKISPTFPGDMNIGAVVYGALPLMATRNCPVRNIPGHKGCPADRNCSITDRMGITFPVLCSGGTSELYNSRPMWLADRMEEFCDLDFVVLYFTTESTEQCKRIIDAYLKKNPPEGTFTRGLYYQKIQ